MSKLAVEDVCNRQMKLSRHQVERLSKERHELKIARNKKRLGYEVANGGGYGEKKYKITKIVRNKKNSTSGSGSGGGGSHFKSSLNTAKAHNVMNKLKDSQIKSLGVILNPKANENDDDENENEDGGGKNEGMSMKKVKGQYETLSCVKIKKNHGGGEGDGLLAYKSIEIRSQRWLDSHRILENKINAIEREEMGYEEAIQRHADVYTEAYERKLDYQV